MVVPTRNEGSNGRLVDEVLGSATCLPCEHSAGSRAATATGIDGVLSVGVLPVSHARFQKRQREKARQEKAAAKRERRAARLPAATAPTEDAVPVDVEARLIAELRELHREYADGELVFDEFEQRKQLLLTQLEL